MFSLLLVATLLLPCMMLAIGLLWRRHPPKDINSLYGYRTPRSTHSRAAWAFAISTAAVCGWRAGARCWPSPWR